jgi:DNA (cytosine-5)-methyltransferase 1
MKQEQKNIANNINTIDLFAGCGGLSLGFKNAGFQLVAAFDNWPSAIKVYQQNFDHPVYNCDLSNLDCLEYLKQSQPELILGAPPCQDFSSAGHRNEDLGRGFLTITFAEIIANIKPNFFVMENVDRLPTSNKYQIARRIFQEANYGLTEKVLDASLCGVPQKRKRFFVVGIRGETDNILKPLFEENLASKAMTVRDYLGNRLGIEHYYRHPRSYQRRAVFSIDEPSPTIRGVNRPIPKNYQQHSGDTASISQGVRPLTTIERSYLQTFPQDFIFEGTKTDLEQMIGNAVPVKLAEYVALCLSDFVDQKSRGFS